MSWLDEQVAKRDELRSREMLLDEYAPKLYADLWDCVVKIIEEAKHKLAELRLFSNGSPKERKIIAASIGASAKDRQMTLLLAPDGHTIAAFFGGGKIVFDVGICEDGVVCLKHGGAIVSGQEAAQMILGPFLFPELQEKS